MPASTRRRYTEENKREAVRLVRESTHPEGETKGSGCVGAKPEESRE